MTNETITLETPGKIRILNVHSLFALKHLQGAVNERAPE